LELTETVSALDERVQVIGLPERTSSNPWTACSKRPLIKPSRARHTSSVFFVGSIAPPPFQLWAKARPTGNVEEQDQRRAGTEGGHHDEPELEPQSSEQAS
jgi:hypothetical protein